MIVEHSIVGDNPTTPYSTSAQSETVSGPDGTEIVAVYHINETTGFWDLAAFTLSDGGSSAVVTATFQSFPADQAGVTVTKQFRLVCVSA